MPSSPPRPTHFKLSSPHPRCDKASENGVTRLAGVRCPNALAFDIERQTCDWKTNVKNCNQLESK